MKKNVRRGGGFTLAELLVVVAIIGVLVAISIPIFREQIHKAEVATDWANLRSYFAELQCDYIETGKFNNKYENEWGKPGLTSFEMDGKEIKLKAGQFWVSERNSGGGYNIAYGCNKGHTECILKLPEDSK